MIITQIDFMNQNLRASAGVSRFTFTSGEQHQTTLLGRAVATVLPGSFAGDGLVMTMAYYEHHIKLEDFGDEC